VNPSSPADPHDDPLGDVLDHHSVVVCTGAGGVGKTTTAAVLALEAAYRGRRACVVTIDPARRLADAMGLEGLTHTPTQVEGPWPGELWAMMLDTKATFDDLVATHATDLEQATEILGNRFYRNISGSLSGTQEYMAMEKLYELHSEERFDLVVVDTPPTRNALDFLEAPRRLTRFLDHRLYRLLVAPTRGLVRAVNLAAQTFLRTVSRVVGAEVVQDAIGFFAAFDGMEAGFRERAASVVELLSDDTTAFVLVTAPRRDVVEEATYFADRLAEAGIAVRALIVNRVHPRFSTESPAVLRQRAQALEGTPLEPYATNLADFSSVAATEEGHLEGLTGRIGAAPIVRVPFLDSDVHDLGGLDRIAAHLFPDAARRSS
jgi:anion-transporting  ArsA/GET3 family ATPase